MSITTYAELQTAVGSWLHRADLTTQIPDFIDLGETMLNRQLRLFSMENSATVNTSITDRFGTLPTGFMQAIDLTLYSDNFPQTLTQIPLSEINFRSIDSTALRLPHFYAISSNIVFDSISDQVYPCNLRYYKKLDIATDLTNAVLTAYPDLYLYSALMSAAPYIKDDGRMATWGALLKGGVQSANRLDAKSRGNAMLVVEPGLRRGQRGDIFTGDT